jgi:hypothetical protein
MEVHRIQKATPYLPRARSSFAMRFGRLRRDLTTAQGPPTQREARLPSADLDQPIYQPSFVLHTSAWCRHALHHTSTRALLSRSVDRGVGRSW